MGIDVDREWSGGTVCLLKMLLLLFDESNQIKSICSIKCENPTGKKSAMSEFLGLMMTQSKNQSSNQRSNQGIK